MTLKELFESGKEQAAKLKEWFDIQIRDSKSFFGKENPKCSVCLEVEGRPALIVRRTTKEVLFQGRVCKRCAQRLLKIYKDSEIIEG